MDDADRKELPMIISHGTPGDSRTLQRHLPELQIDIKRKGDKPMKKNPGRKERRNVERSNRRREAREKQKLNEKAQRMGLKSYRDMEEK